METTGSEEVRLARVARERAQEELAMKRKRAYQNIFQQGDRVRVRDPARGNWEKQGEITDVISSLDGVVRSVIMRLDSGELLYRHQTYLRHVL